MLALTASQPVPKDMQLIDHGTKGASSSEAVRVSESPSVPPAYADCHRFRFGDNATLSDALIDLVLAGTKTGTCWPLRDADTEPMVTVGERVVYTDWHGMPRCVVEYTRVETVAFDAVGAPFALSEGENDSLAGWQADHRRYFERNGGWSPDMALVCESFRVVEVL